MKFNNRLVYGILSIVLALIIAFIAIPITSRKANSRINIVRITSTVEKGTPIKSEHIESVEVGGYNLPSGIVTNSEDVIGSYATSTLLPGDYIVEGKTSNIPLSSDEALNDIPSGMTAISITTQTLASSLSDKLQPGDIVRLYYFNNDTLKSEDSKELKFIKTLSVTNSEGENVDYSKPLKEDEETLHTATITVLASPEQALKLIECENTGIIHAALIARGDEKLAKELLENQAKMIKELYSSSSDSKSGGE